MTLLYPNLMACYNKVCYNLTKCVIKGLHCSIYTFLEKQEKNMILWNPLPWRETFLRGLRTTKAQTSLRIRSLISTFVIRYLESIISKLASSEISIF